MTDTYRQIPERIAHFFEVRVLLQILFAGRAFNTQCPAPGFVGQQVRLTADANAGGGHGWAVVQQDVGRHGATPDEARWVSLRSTPSYRTIRPWRATRTSSLTRLCSPSALGACSTARSKLSLAKRARDSSSHTNWIRKARGRPRRVGQPSR